MTDPETAMMVEAVWEMLEPLNPDEQTAVLFEVIGRMYRQQAECSVTMPFGKYKGYPISEVLSDRGYIEWLAAQNWVKMKHPWVAEIVEKVTL